MGVREEDAADLAQVPGESKSDDAQDKDALEVAEVDVADAVSSGEEVRSEHSPPLPPPHREPPLGRWQTSHGLYEVLEYNGSVMYREEFHSGLLTGTLVPNEGWWEGVVRCQADVEDPTLGRFRVRLEGGAAVSQVLSGDEDWSCQDVVSATRVPDIVPESEKSASCEGAEVHVAKDGMLPDPPPPMPSAKPPPPPPPPGRAVIHDASRHIPELPPPSPDRQDPWVANADPWAHPDSDPWGRSAPAAGDVPRESDRPVDDKDDKQELPRNAMQRVIMHHLGNPSRTPRQGSEVVQKAAPPGPPRQESCGTWSGAIPERGAALVAPVVCRNSLPPPPPPRTRAPGAPGAPGLPAPGSPVPLPPLHSAQPDQSARRTEDALVAFLRQDPSAVEERKRLLTKLGHMGREIHSFKLTTSIVEGAFKKLETEPETEPPALESVEWEPVRPVHLEPRVEPESWRSEWASNAWDWNGSWWSWSESGAVTPATDLHDLTSPVQDYKWKYQ